MQGGLLSVAFDEGVDARLEITRQIVVARQDALLERLMPVFDLPVLCGIGTIDEVRQ